MATAAPPRKETIQLADIPEAMCCAVSPAFRVAHAPASASMCFPSVCLCGSPGRQVCYLC